MNKHTKMIIGGIVVAVLLFYGGVAYGKKHASASTFAAGARGAAGMQFAGRTGARGATVGGAGGGLVTGTVLTKDAQGFTVSIMGGGSKIVFVGSSTPIMKTVSGSAADLVTGANVAVTGQANPDGSVTARSVELRPAPPAMTTTSNQ